jgi:hypothetical protein
MEIEEVKNTTVRKYILIIAGLFFLAFFIYYAIMMIMAPVKKLEDLRNEYGYKKDEKVKLDEKLFTDSTYLTLYKEKTFFQSRIEMAETDSIYLTISLSDSIINMGISGVVVHSSKITKLKYSKILRNGDDYIITSLLSRPLSIINDFSSIEKEPLMIKMAPKDTSEFQPDIIPDTADYEPVNYILEMNNGITIFVYQSEKIKPGDRIRLLRFDFRYRLRSTLQSLKSVVTFKIPDYHIFIKIRLPRSDSKIIYRAIPKRGQITVHL